MNKNIILASNSPRRKEILESLKFEFTVQASNFDENSVDEKNPVVLCKKIARGKGLNVYKDLENSLFAESNMQDVFDQSIIIAADTLVFCGNKVFGKAKNKEEAREMLQNLSNNKHSVITAIFCMDLNTKQIIEKQSESFVFFKNMSSEEIDFYIGTQEWLGVAGAYRIQGRGSFFVKRIEGSYSSIMGLPIHELYEVLHDFRFDFKKKY